MGIKVYMTHPEHGAMHVYAQWHLDDNLKNGWKVGREPWLKEVAEDVAEEVVGEEAPKRRGRPPKS
jgi:hypothetical protein